MTSKIDKAVLPVFESFYSASEPGKLYALEPEKVASEYALFEDDRTYTPDLRPTVDTNAIAEAIALSDEVRGGLDTIALSSLRQAYDTKLTERDASLRQFEAIHTGDARVFKRADMTIHGEFDRDFGRASLAYLDEWSRMFSEGTLSQRHVATDLQRRIAETMTPGATSAIYPSESIYEAAKTAHENFYHRLLGDIAICDLVTHEDRKLIIPQMLANLGAPENMYAHVPRKKGITTWAISHAGRGEIRDPGLDMTRKRFVGMIGGHEIGTHVSERLNAMDGPVGLLEYGLAQYLHAGEAKGVMRETFAYDTIAEFQKLGRNQEIVLRAVLNAIVNMRPRTSFREWFEFAEDVHALQILSEQPDLTVEEAVAQAFSKARNSIKRAWRGGMVDASGAILPKREDESYLRGLNAQFQLAAKDPLYVERADLGKYNLANPQHRAQLDDWGITARK